MSTQFFNGCTMNSDTTSSLKEFFNNREVSVKRARWKNRAIGLSQSHLKVLCTFIWYLVSDRCQLILTCHTAAKWLSVVYLSSGQWCLADFTAVHRQIGRTPSRAQPASGRHLTDIWIVWVVQNLARHPPNVCDDLTDIVRLQWETPHQVLSPS